MKKDTLLSLLKDKLTDSEFDITIKLSYIKFNKDSIRNKFYQSILDGYTDLEKEWELFKVPYSKYESSLLSKINTT